MDAYGEAGPWGVKITEQHASRWFEHHRGGPAPMTKERARALADTLNRNGLRWTCKPLPLVWTGSKYEAK
jgi:hypothetical protein